MKIIPIKLYKASSTDHTKGSAVRFDIKAARKEPSKNKAGADSFQYDEGCVYATIVKQNGEKSFDWEKRSVIKLNAVECAQIYNALANNKSVDLIHKVNDRITTMKLDHTEYQGKKYVKMQIGIKAGETVGYTSFSMSEAESILVTEFFRVAMFEVFRLYE